MALYTPQRLSDEVHSALDRARARRAALTSLPADAPAAGVLADFDHIRRELDECGERAGTFSSVHPDEPVRDMAETLEQELVTFDTELFLDRAIYERLETLDPATLESDEEVRLLEHSLRDFRRSGVDRDEATRGRVLELQR
ncbi:MAG: peptidase M3, partial [Planctomycetota bacterium]